MLHKLFSLFFPAKCILCKKILSKQETDLCHTCRETAPEYKKAKFKIPFVAGWTSLWYYKENVRNSLLRYKFYNARSYASAYGRLLSMALLKENPERFDVLTWVPISRLRRLRRGYDQVELIAKVVSEELQVSSVKTLQKIRHTPPQSGLKDISQRKANILGAYRAIEPSFLSGKTVLLLDDIITTGATASECARVLLTAGAKEVYCAAIAAAPHDK